MTNTNTLSYMKLKDLVLEGINLMMDGKLPPESQPWTATLISELLGRLENTTTANEASIAAYEAMSKGVGNGLREKEKIV